MTDTLKTKVKPYEFEIILGYAKALWETAQTYNQVQKKMEEVCKNISIDFFNELSWELSEPTKDELLEVFEVERI